MKTTPLSGRERVRLALAHQETDRVPIAMVCSGIHEPSRTGLARLVAQRCGCTLDEYLDGLLDIRHVAPQYRGPPLKPNTDIWGVRRIPVNHGQGVYYEIEHYPLAGAATLDDVARHPWPSPDLFDYSVIPDRIRAAQAGGERCILVSNGNVFESYWYMRGFEQAFLDMAADPPMADEILRRVAAFYEEYFRRILSAGRGEIDLVFTADDIGGQNGLLMSLGMWARFVEPHHRKLNAVIHQYGARVIYHSDGAVMEAIPGLIGMGIDVLQALQFDAAGMDAAEMKRRYGDRLCFQGGVSVQKTLPFGTVEQVRSEVECLISTLGKDGGYILGPSHAIQAGTPPENILAMFETARRYTPRQ